MKTVTYLTLVGIFLTSCHTTRKFRKGIQPRSFFEFYLRAREEQAAGNWQAAGNDFQVAMGLRPGASYGKGRDQLLVRTYGMHFEHNYYPNRELGICLLQLAKTRPTEAPELLQKAKKHLQLSMAQSPTKRAEHYLAQTNAKDHLEVKEIY